MLTVGNMYEIYCFSVFSSECMSHVVANGIYLAGILVGGGIEKISMEDYDKQMHINTRQVFLMMKLALPHILERKGNIVNISSVTGLRSVSFSVTYDLVFMKNIVPRIDR